MTQACEEAAMERRKAMVAVEEKIVQELRDHMTNEDEQKERGKRWHVGKEIPIALIAGLFIQTAGLIWGASALFSRVDYIERASSVAMVAQVTIDKRQDDDARRSEDRIVAQLDKINTKLDRVMELKGPVR